MRDFTKGLNDGVAIGLGYLSVSFSFGINAVSGGLGILQSVLISMTNLTSAGQVAGLSSMMQLAPLLELMVLQLTINIRYSLMSISLSQKLDDSSFGFLFNSEIIRSVLPVKSSHHKYSMLPEIGRAHV